VPLPEGVSDPPPIPEVVPVLPIRKDGSEGRWQLKPATLRSRMAQGRVHIGGSQASGYTIYYLKPAEYAKVVGGDYPVDGHYPDGALKVGEVEADEVQAVPTTQWRVASHDSTQYGSRLLQKILPGRDFTFPKSLYAVEDCLRFFVKNKPDALVLDFFAGSGTTCHALMRLNEEDDGARRSIIVTNNEVSAVEAASLRAQGLRPGDAEWEALGICEYITKPRIAAAVTGLTPDGTHIEGDYAHNMPGELAEGLQANVEFFDLSYEDVSEIRLDMAFNALAPLLWMRAGAQGSRIEAPASDYALADRYAVLFNLDAAAPFLAEVKKATGIRCVFLITDSEAQYQLVAAELAEGVKPVRLYEDYLRSLETSIGKG